MEGNPTPNRIRPLPESALAALRYDFQLASCALFVVTKILVQSTNHENATPELQAAVRYAYQETVGVRGAIAIYRKALGFRNCGVCSQSLLSLLQVPLKWDYKYIGFLFRFLRDCLFILSVSRLLNSFCGIFLIQFVERTSLTFDIFTAGQTHSY